MYKKLKLGTPRFEPNIYRMEFQIIGLSKTQLDARPETQLSIWRSVLL
jgi:hypothetical protein